MRSPSSPAVKSLEAEQARKQVSRVEASDLERALDDTFPASDPVPAPLVDQALAGVNDRADDDGSLAAAELDALRAEIASLREHLAEIGASSIRVARAETQYRVDGFRFHVRKRPLTALAVAACAGMIWGRIR